MTKGKSILLYATLTIVGIYFLFLGLAKAESFFIPLITAVILALLVTPLSNKMEKKISNRAAASFANTLLLFFISVGFIALLSFQVKNLMEDWNKIKEKMQPKVEQLKDFVLEYTPVSPETLEGTSIKNSMPLTGSNAKPAEKAAKYFSSIMSFFGDFLITFIYIFFLLTYRKRFKQFLLRLFPDERKHEVKHVIHKSASVTQKYLVGKLLLIGVLAVLYAVGLGISGVKNFILVSALAALFSLIPYIGNIIGFGLALAFGFLTTGDTNVFIGIVITFAIAQFVESYILEPYVIGDQVDLHPFFVIISVVIGGMVWGVMGMILSIPILAIINVVFLNINPLEPFGFLLSKENKD